MLRTNAAKSTLAFSYFLINGCERSCSAVGLASASFCRQASINEQNSGEKMSFGGDGDGSSRIY